MNLIWAPSSAPHACMSLRSYPAKFSDFTSGSSEFLQLEIKNFVITMIKRRRSVTSVGDNYEERHHLSHLIPLIKSLSAQSGSRMWVIKTLRNRLWRLFVFVPVTAH